MVAQVEQPPDITNYHIFTLAERNYEDLVMRAAARLCDHIMFKIIGFIGSVPTVRHVFEEERKPHLFIKAQRLARASMGLALALTTITISVTCRLWRKEGVVSS